VYDTELSGRLVTPSRATDAAVISAKEDAAGGTPGAQAPGVIIIVGISMDIVSVIMKVTMLFRSWVKTVKLSGECSRLFCDCGACGVAQNLPLQKFITLAPAKH
jgi:hypothetical protein